MDLQELKHRFRHKTKVELSDIDLALQAVPFLLREIESLESELAGCEQRARHLASQINRKRILSCQGDKDGTQWRAELDDRKNRLFMQFSGSISYKTAKMASSSMHPIFLNIRKNCNVINDLSGLSGINKRVMFHFRKIFYTLDLMGVERIIHIPPSEDMALRSALQDVSDNWGYQVITANSFKEAEEILEKCSHFLKA